MLNRVFWDLHSFTWDGGVSPIEASRRAAELVSWVAAWGRPGASVLDVGCATGSLALAMAAAGYSVTAIDVSPAMLRRASAKAIAQDGEAVRVRVAQCDLEQARAPEPGTYEIAVCLGVLQCAGSPERLLAAIGRALAPAGVVLLEVKDGANPAMPAKGHALVSRLFAPVKRWASGSGAVHAFTRLDLEGALHSAGLRVVGDRSGPGWLRLTACAA
jgi:SAM-dependent methyltransferase